MSSGGPGAGGLASPSVRQQRESAERGEDERRWLGNIGCAAYVGRNVQSVYGAVDIDVAVHRWPRRVRMRLPPTNASCRSEMTADRHVRIVGEVAALGAERQGGELLRERRMEALDRKRIMGCVDESR